MTKKLAALQVYWLVEIYLLSIKTYSRVVHIGFNNIDISIYWVNKAIFKILSHLLIFNKLGKEYWKNIVLVFDFMRIIGFKSEDIDIVMISIAKLCYCIGLTSDWLVLWDTCWLSDSVQNWQNWGTKWHHTKLFPFPTNLFHSFWC